MCTIAAALTAGGTLMQGYSQYRAGNAQAQAAEYSAKLAEQQGRDAVMRGGTEEMRLRRSLDRQRGTQRAAMTAAGIAADSGSALDIQTRSMTEGERDAAAIRFNAAREKWGYDAQGVNYRNQASASRSAGRNALLGSAIGAASGAYEPVGDYFSNVRKRRNGR